MSYVGTQGPAGCVAPAKFEEAPHQELLQMLCERNANMLERVLRINRKLTGLMPPEPPLKNARPNGIGGKLDELDNTSTLINMLLIHVEESL